MDELINFLNTIATTDLSHWNFEDQLKLVAAVEHFKKEALPLYLKNDVKRPTSAMYLFKM